MNTSDLLEQLLRAGQGSRERQGGASAQGGIDGGLGGLLGGLLGGGGGSATGGGGLGGLLGGLLGGGSPLGGSTRTRSSGGTNYAALASLGMMAFQAYQAWQRSQAAAPQQAPRTVDLLSGPEVEEHSHAVLRALIAAAKADGRIDDAEKQMISTELGRHTDDPQLQQWLDDEVARPLDAADVAQSATDPGMASEMYLASVMLVDDQQDAERNYLDELAAALKIDPELQVHLEQQAKGGAV
ncbi:MULTISPECIES: tellurite resistance TerB family protein [Pseudomonas]|uniref:Tellurite resistance TerB family protein n=3 Tax=Pseudomonas TaxID=286 RepID=A0AB36D3G0_9PSED|nr:MULTISPECIES: tellurite resistance TerB family protein [Pseudomonas]MBU0522500.1 tellurite resistance TerB family protein [Gammaproteobacteria bacterium]MBU0877873.1 tellurite resistance TerB family protein [Alphaproteobacteria bacterium]MBU0819158.1 tellurite resistance TerB family protein [Gammaproteobacteria bacterium]MBU1840985.1 tellurite resistance TerB family protein [Gammaproteobacteria bacterium]MDO8712321.1 tellurite resistance TerB family protein [Pseudomonas sp.]